MIIFLSVYTFGDFITVLKSTQEISRSGAEIRASSLYGLKDVTICARFNTFQFSVRQKWLPFQIMFALGRDTLLGSASLLHSPSPILLEWFGSSWEPMGVVGYCFLNEFANVFPIWKMGEDVWNNVCIIISNTDKEFKIVLNRKTVFHKTDYDGSILKLNNNLRLMGNYWENNISYSMSHYGQLSDVNIWNRSFSDTEVSKWADCDIDMESEGNIVSWSKADVDSDGLETIMVDKNVMCKNQITSYYVVSEKKKNFYDSQVFCKNILGGEVAILKDKTTKNNILTIVSEHENCGNSFFSGYFKKEGQFLNIIDGKVMNFDYWQPDEPKNRGDKVCSTFYATGNVADSCNNLFCSVCKLKGPMVYRLSGVCKESIVDRYYVFYNDSMPYKEMLGYIQTRMVWSSTERMVTIVDIKNNNTLAYINDTEDFPFGTHPWYFTNDECKDDEDDFRMMNLHQAVEQPGHFCCANGVCIDSELRCDNILNCDNHSDELDCEIIQIPSTGYDPKVTPIKKATNGKIMSFPNIDLKVSFSILKIIDINDDDSDISILFNVTYQWTDPLLMFFFLKDDQYKNQIKPNESAKIWTPQIDFLLLKKDSLQKLKEQITVKKKGEATKSDVDSVVPKEIYAGNENIIEIKRLYQGVFICDFDSITEYPFDEERCNLYIDCSGEGCANVNLNPGALMILPKSFGQYKVLFVNETLTIKEKHILTVEILLGRNIGSIFLVTYLPTILMNIINQSANYVRSSGSCEFVATINVTCMMVLASVYISVSSNLPLTKSIKPVEVWLLFNLGYPFLIIIINIFQQVKIIK